MQDNNNTQQQRTNTSTQIRNMYSDGMCYMNISFFNTNLSLKFFPFLNKSNSGYNRYDTNNGQSTTVNYEGAYALYNMAKEIIDGKIQEANLTIPCAGGANLTFERKMGQNGQMETILSIAKNNVVIPFRFQTVVQQVKENGQPITKVIETGLGVFMKTIDGYLTGINADRHLDKLTDDYVKMKESQGGPQQQSGFRGQSGGYPKRSYGGQQGGYKKPYGGQNRTGGQQNNWGGPQQQNMSGYQLPN